jgi:hypothetical protein
MLAHIHRTANAQRIIWLSPRSVDLKQEPQASARPQKSIMRVCRKHFCMLRKFIRPDCFWIDRRQSRRISFHMHVGIFGLMKVNVSRILPAADLSRQSRQAPKILGALQTTLPQKRSFMPSLRRESGRTAAFSMNVSFAQSIRQLRAVFENKRQAPACGNTTSLFQASVAAFQFHKDYAKMNHELRTSRNESAGN